MHVGRKRSDLTVKEKLKINIWSLIRSLAVLTVHVAAIISTAVMRWYCCNIDLVCVPTDKLFSLLPEYVVPYTIHLLAHDPDYVKVQDIEQLKEIKE